MTAADARAEVEVVVAVADERLYRLEPLDRTGVFLGLGVVQCLFMGTGMFLAVLGISAGLPLPLAAVPLLVGAGVAFGRAASRPAWEWLPLGAAWLWAMVTGRRQWFAPLPLWPVDADRPPSLPPCLAGLDVVEVKGRTGTVMAAVRDVERRTLTTVVPVRGASFVVEPSEEQERLLASWGDLLSQFAAGQTAVSHVGWSALTRPSGLDDHLSWLADDAPGRDFDPDARDSYSELLGLALDDATVHEVVVTVTVARDRLSRRAGGTGGDERLGAALAGAVDALLRGLHSGGLDADAPLDADDIRRLLRVRIDPHRPPRPQGGRLAARLGLVPPRPAPSTGPLVVDTAWRSVRVDGAWHRAWWVASWPRLAVPAAWLEPFLATDSVTRTMTVALVPVPGHRSRRRIEREMVKLESDASTKEERGRRVDTGHQRVTEALLEREQELVAGFAEMAYVGLVGVTASNESELEAHAEVVEQLAHECGMELRSLDGRQDVAWAATLPFGLVPRSLLAT